MAQQSNNKQKLEFGGPWGNLAIVVFLPIFTWYLFYCIRFNGGHLLLTELPNWDEFLPAIAPTWRALLVWVVWFALQAFLQEFAPGKKVKGTELQDGSRLNYKINGMLSMWISFAFVAAMHVTGLYPLTMLIEDFGSLLTIVIIFSFLFSGWLYFYGKKVDPYRLSGNPIHDFWMGTGLNPRWPDTRDGIDWKFFCEGRPGLIGWMVLNGALAYTQYDKYGFVSLAMILVILMQSIYIFNYFQAESFVLTTMDIKHEKFGFMLVFGDLAWVPFTYCLQAFYLVDHVHDLPIWGAFLIIVFNLVGYILFREANLQKDRFKADPENTIIWGKPAEYLETDRGGKLLTSGFWGWARHFNYVGDLMMATAWSLPCLFGAIVPYFYPIYFAILLIHRERRDDHQCAEKYGKDWERYRQAVPWRILPGVY